MYREKIIELHQQKLCVESQLNQGSQFNFTLKSSWFFLLGCITPSLAEMRDDIET